jgi:hypothetical protein
MRRGATRLGIAIALVAVACAGATALSYAQTIYVEVGAVKTTFSASVKPKALPKAKRGPIAVRLSTQLIDRDAAHIPAIARANIGIDRSLSVDARGIPVCTAGQLENQTTAGAEAACATAIVGSGSVSVEISLGGGAPIVAESRLLAFNGGVAGGTTSVLVHAYISTPAAQALVVPITLTRLAKGGYGMRAQATIPKIAGGAGSLASFDLALRRLVATSAGKKHGYLLARCSDGNFVFEPEVEFDDGNLARGLLAQGCNTAR